MFKLEPQSRQTVEKMNRYHFTAFLYLRQMRYVLPVVCRFVFYLSVGRITQEIVDEF